MLSDPEASETKSFRGPSENPTDSELIDRLERDIQGNPLVLWDGSGEFPGRTSRLRGLSLVGGRTLRQALAVLGPTGLARLEADTESGNGGSKEKT